MVLGPSSPSSWLEAARGCCAGDPSIGGSEIRGEVCRNMERTGMCRLRGDGGGGRREVKTRACKGISDHNTANFAM